MSQPIPPPSVSPPMPVSPNVPPTTARPCAHAAVSTSSHSAPPATRTMPVVGVDGDLALVAQVDHERAVRHPVAGDAVPAAADRDRQAEVTGRDHRRHDVLDRADPDDDRGSALRRSR